MYETVGGQRWDISTLAKLDDWSEFVESEVSKFRHVDVTSSHPDVLRALAIYKGNIRAYQETVELPRNAEDWAVSVANGRLQDAGAATRLPVGRRYPSAHGGDPVDGERPMVLPDRARWKGQGFPFGSLSLVEQDAFMAGLAHKQTGAQGPFGDSSMYDGGAPVTTAYQAGWFTGISQDRLDGDPPLSQSETVLIRENGGDVVRLSLVRRVPSLDGMYEGIMVEEDGSVGPSVEFSSGQVFAVDDGPPVFG